MCDSNCVNVKASFCFLVSDKNNIFKSADSNVFLLVESTCTLKKVLSSITYHFVTYAGVSKQTLYKPVSSKAKVTSWHVHLSKTQISLHICAG